MLKNNNSLHKSKYKKDYNNIKEISRQIKNKTNNRTSRMNKLF